MSMLKKDGSSIYDHFNKTDPVTLAFDLDHFVERLEGANYGTVRLFAAIIRVRRRRFAERLDEYRARGDMDIVQRLESRGDPVEQALVHLLVNDEF